MDLVSLWNEAKLITLDPIIIYIGKSYRGITESSFAIFFYIYIEAGDILCDLLVQNDFRQS
jgi:hypothetical protein